MEHEPWLELVGSDPVFLRRFGDLAREAAAVDVLTLGSSMGRTGRPAAPRA